MPLNYHFQDAQKPEIKALLKGDEWTTTYAIIHLTMTVGMSTITKENAVEFWTRVNFHEKLFGARMYESTDNGPIPLFVTLQDVEKRVGLHTNASNLTITKFLRQETDLHWQECKRESERAKKEVKK